jgi:hypothetical protein
MAITITRKPAQFFNCTNPAIFEFTTDAATGNFNDYVSDIFISSAYTTKTAVIRSIFPNTTTRIFSVDASEFFKALQLNGFEFDFNGSKNLAIEKFNIGIKIRDGSQPDSEIFSYNDYYFDNFVFTDGLSIIDDTDILGAYSILGERLLFDSFTNPLVTNKLTFLTADTIEVCKGFDNYIPVFINELTGNTLSVVGTSTPIPDIKGVSTVLLTEPQVNVIGSLREITTTNQNINKKVFAFPFKTSCNEIVQFRFFNPKGGFSYFYCVLDSQKDDRGKTDFYDNGYFNENENKSGAVQSSSDYKNTLQFQGSKIIKLKENFQYLLRSPKVEMNLKQLNGNDVFIECEVSGSSVDQYTNFDFNLTAVIKNTQNFKL